MKGLKNRGPLAAMFFALALSGCAYFRDDSDVVDDSGYAIERVKAAARPLTLERSTPVAPAIQAYFDFYDLNPLGVRHAFGTVESRGETLAAHLFIPETPKGTLVMLHGYFDHVGTLSKLIAEAVRHDYVVVAWDLPGHGLSTGDRTDTGGFDLCAEQLKDLIERAAPSCPRPIHLVSHSTGCSIAMEHLFTTQSNPIEEYVFLAPLVRHAHWGWAKFGYAISNPFINKVRRREKMNSSDQAYLDFVKKDPLHHDELDYDYLKELYAWEKRFRAYPPSAKSPLIIQGDRDDIVDWRHNLEVLREKFDAPEEYLIEGARHQLANETPEYRDAAFEKLFAWLSSRESIERCSPSTK